MNSCRILIVGDETAGTKDMEERLTGMGYQVAEWTDDPEQAPDLTRRQKPDLVFIGSSVRGTTDGITAAERIHHEFDLPVVLIRDNTDDAEHGKTEDSRPFGSVFKPFNNRELRTAIETALHRHRIEAEVRHLRELNEQTQKKLIETGKALHASEERLSMALATSRMGVWELNVAEDRFCWSPECGEIFHTRESSGSHETYAGFVHPDDLQRVLSSARMALAQKVLHEVEYRVLRPDGETRWVSSLGRAEYDSSGKPVRMVGILRDITSSRYEKEERTRSEARLAQAQKMEALGTLAGGIAHDFNNILGIILGYTEMVLWNKEEGSNEHNQLSEVLKATYRAKELVKQILAFSRRSEHEKKPVQIGLVVKEAMKMLRASLPSTIEIKTNVPSHAVVLADPTQVHQVLMNLCTNAAHAMRQRGGVLDVNLTDVHVEPADIRPHSDLQPGHYVLLTVRDTGHGINPAVLNRIFDPFFTTKEQGVGTGLGLAVVHGIVKSHGGAIEVESTVDEGTCFQVFFPAIEKAPGQDKIDATPLPRGAERILVVDDEPALTLVLTKILERLGYQVECRTNGVEALEVFRDSLASAPFELLVTDMTMPHLTGVDLAGELHRMVPDLPVIVCTGFSEQISEDRARGLGIQGFLTKPVVARELAELVRKVLDRR